MPIIHSNKELIKRHEHSIEILENDLLTYGKHDKTIAEYDKKEITKSKLALEKLKKESEKMEILNAKYNNQLRLIKYNNDFYTIDFDNASVGITLITDTTLNGIKHKWEELLNIIIELVELDMDYSKENLKLELERIHGNLIVDFDTLYSIRKEFLN